MVRKAALRGKNKGGEWKSSDAASASGSTGHQSSHSPCRKFFLFYVILWLPQTLYAPIQILTQLRCQLFLEAFMGPKSHRCSGHLLLVPWHSPHTHHVLMVHCDHLSLFPTISFPYLILLQWTPAPISFIFVFSVY